MSKNYGYYNLSFIYALSEEFRGFGGIGYEQKLILSHDGFQFSRALKREPKVSSIKQHGTTIDFKDRMLRIYPKEILKNLSVLVKSSFIKSKDVPIIVEACEEGYKDVICPEIIYAVKKYENVNSFPKFEVKSSETIRPGVIAELIRSMNDKELEDYAVKANKLSQFIESYGQALINVPQEKQIHDCFDYDKLQSVASEPKLNVQIDEESKEIAENAFVRNFQSSKGQALASKIKN